MNEHCKNCQRLQEEVERLTKALREIGVESHHPSKQFESGEIDDDEYAEGNEGSLALIGIWANKAITRTDNLRELAKRAVKQSELDKNATPAEIDAWADKLAKSSVECGEDEVITRETITWRGPNKDWVPVDKLTKSSVECDEDETTQNDGGYGTSDCPECGGSGKVNDPNLFGAMVSCPKCKEEGK